MNARTGLRMLRSAPAMDLGVVADAVGMSVRDLVLEVEQLRGRGHCDRVAADATSFPHVTRAKKLQILAHRVCPPFVKLCSTWDTDVAASDSVPGTARWTRRSVESPGAPRVAFTSVAAPVPALHVAEQAHCPLAIAVWLAGSGAALCTERLAAVTPHPAALAALATSADADTRSVATERDDLPSALAAAIDRKL